MRPLTRRSYIENGLIGMLERNIALKDKPERFQDAKDQFDVIITCEGRVFEEAAKSACMLVLHSSLFAALEEQASATLKPVHVVNFEIKDTPETATIGAFQIVDFCHQACRMCASFLVTRSSWTGRRTLTRRLSA